MVSIDIRNVDLGTEITTIHGSQQVAFSSITQDSRRCTPGCCFAAICGLHSDGHRFIAQACEAGAVLVMHEQPVDSALLKEFSSTTFVQTNNSRRAFSALSAHLHNKPSNRLEVIGVTGTDGKSTTVGLIHQLLALCGKRAGFLSTVSMHNGTELVKNSLRQSTPEADEIQARLAEMLDCGCEYAVIEATSHGLSPKTARLADVRFTSAVFTNISHEHLEFHGTFEQYKTDKGNLFQSTEKIAVFNADEPHSRDMMHRVSPGAQVYWYSLSPPAGAPQSCFWAEEIEAGSAGSSFLLCSGSERYESVTSLIGEINIANILAATAAVHTTAGVPLSELAEKISLLQGPRGRMMRIDHGQPFTLFVDYAHTPGSFQKLLPMLKNLTENRLIVVFGSAGKRDTAKRPMQGEIADQHANVIVLTDEDPREEDSMCILKDIASGIHRKTLDQDLFMTPDRRAAIEQACRMAESGDIVVTLGKGHESTIQYSNGDSPWDEPSIAREILNRMGYSQQPHQSA